MSDSPPTDAEPKPYCLAFLTDQWEWEVEFVADTLDEARTASRAALIDLVRDEKPELACATLLQGEVKIGVWDWVEQQAIWTPL